MEAIIEKIVITLFSGAIIAIVTMFGNHFLSLYRDKIKFDQDSLEKRLGATQQNTIQLGILNAHIERLLEDVKSLPKIKEDLNYLHQWRKNHVKEHEKESDDDDNDEH